MIGIFQARGGLDHGRRLQIRHQLLLIKIGLAVDELSAVGAVAGEAAAMRQQLRDRGFRDPRVQPFDILPDRIVQPQFAPLAQLHDAGCGKALRVRGDPKPVPRRQLLAGVEVGGSEGVFGDDLAAVGDSDHAAGLLHALHLKFEPVADVVHRVSQPWLHRRTKCQGKRSDAVNIQSIRCWMLSDKTKPAQPFSCAGWIVVDEIRLRFAC
jgi:hypothetical protein